MQFNDLDIGDTFVFVGFVPGRAGLFCKTSPTEYVAEGSSDQVTAGLYNRVKKVVNKRRLEQIVAEHGLKVDGTRGHVGEYRDLEIGVGAQQHQLQALKLALQARGCPCAMKIAFVDVKDHPDYGKAYLEVSSFWMA